MTISTTMSGWQSIKSCASNRAVSVAETGALVGAILGTAIEVSVNAETSSETAEKLCSIASIISEGIAVTILTKKLYGDGAEKNAAIAASTLATTWVVIQKRGICGTFVGATLGGLGGYGIGWLGGLLEGTIQCVYQREKLQ